jgi:hypothetical protein
MTESSSRRLSIDDAARLIYQTSRPSARQLSKVRHTVARGVLQGSLEGNWVTTSSVASYLAARVVKSSADRSRRSGRTDAGRDAPATSARIADMADGELPRVYRHILRDYFAAVLRRRQPTGTSRAYRAAVWAGQIAVVLFPVVVIVGAAVRVTAPPPERRAIERWIDADTRQYEILKWFPPERPRSGGVIVRVRYKYVGDSPKAIVTDRRFRVQEEDVTLLDSD